MARRAGAILAVADVERSVAFYRDRIGFEVEALYDDPPYATLTLAGTASRSPSRGTRRRTGRGSRWSAPGDPVAGGVVLVLEVDDARAEHRGSRAGDASWRTVRAAVGRLPLLTSTPIDRCEH